MSSLQDAVKEHESKIGTEVGVSNWITVDQKMIDDFAKTTFDEQWIHVDPEQLWHEQDAVPDAGGCRIAGAGPVHPAGRQGAQ